MANNARAHRLAAKGGWIGVDLDGTLAGYSGWKGPTVIGAPVPKMVARVKAWVEAGIEVRVFTARISASEGRSEVKRAIIGWLREHLGYELQITCEKDFHMIELWDDRCVQVIPNTGERADGKEG